MIILNISILEGKFLISHLNGDNKEYFVICNRTKYPKPYNELRPEYTLVASSGIYTLVLRPNNALEVDGKSFESYDALKEKFGSDITESSLYNSDSFPTNLYSIIDNNKPSILDLSIEKAQYLVRNLCDTEDKPFHIVCCSVGKYYLVTKDSVKKFAFQQDGSYKIGDYNFSGLKDIQKYYDFDIKESELYKSNKIDKIIEEMPDTYKNHET